MAEDQWTAAGFTEAPATVAERFSGQEAEASPPGATFNQRFSGAPAGPPPQAPTDFQRPQPGGFDEWDQAGFTPPPAPDYGALKYLPDSVQSKATAGAGILKSLDDSVVGQTLQAIRQGVQKPQDQLVQEWADGTKQAAAEGQQQISSGIDDMAKGFVASGPAKIASGVMSWGLAPLFGAAKAVGQEATKTTGDPVFGEKIETALSLISPFPEFNPLISTPEGKMARLVMGADGKIDTRIIGRPPVAADFGRAAHTIAAEAGIPENAAAIESKLVDYWINHGVHPDEAVAISRDSPVMAGDLSSAVTGPVPLPARPSRAFINDLDDRLYALRGNFRADQSEMLNEVMSWPPEMRDPDVYTNIYRHMEGDPEARPLTAAQEKFMNEKLIPARQMATEVYARLKKIGMTATKDGHDPLEDLDPNYMHRQVVGQTPEVDRYTGAASNNDNPIYAGPGLLSQRTSSLENRSFFVAEDAAGNRRVVQIYDGGMRTVSKDPTVKPDTLSSEDPIHVGDTIKMNDNVSYTIKQAYTREIEEATNLKYYGNPGMSIYDNLLHLRAVERAVEFAQRLRNTPEWEVYATRGKEQPGWVSPQMPLFKNDKMDPKLAHLIDDFWGTRDQDGISIATSKINNLAVGSMFWTPFPHAFNETAWWGTARGWDWVTPQGMKSLIYDTGEAIREVISQGPKFQAAMRSGAGLVYGNVVNHNFYSDFAKALGVQMQRDPGALEQLIRDAKLGSGFDVVKAIYQGSAKALWGYSAILQMQRILELERKGMSLESAISATERRMIDYRKPPEIPLLPQRLADRLGTDRGSTSTADAYFNPTWFEFSRYHWGVMSRFAQLGKDLIDIRDPKQSFDALGSVLALGAYTLFVTPAINAALQNVTGNHDIRIPSFGPGRLASVVASKIVNMNPSLWPESTQKYYGNKVDMMQQLTNLVPFSPALQFAGELAFNQYRYTGLPVRQPGSGFGQQAAQEAEHTAQTFVQPYSMVNDMYKYGQSVPSALAEHMFGLDEITPDQVAGKAKAEAFQARAAVKRGVKRPVGMIEDLENKVAQ